MKQISNRQKFINEMPYEILHFLIKYKMLNSFVTKYLEFALKLPLMANYNNFLVCSRSVSTGSYNYLKNKLKLNKNFKAMIWKQKKQDVRL